MDPLKTSRVINITLAILLGLCFTLNWGTRERNRSLVTKFDQERLKSEALLSEKLASQKELQKFKDKFFDLREENFGQNHAVEIAGTKIKEMKAGFKQLEAENRLLRSEKKEALQSVLDYEYKLEVAQSLNDKLETENVQLKSSNTLLQNTNVSDSMKTGY